MGAWVFDMAGEVDDGVSPLDCVPFRPTCETPIRSAGTSDAQLCWCTSAVEPPSELSSSSP